MEEEKQPTQETTLTAKLEALLFQYGEPIAMDRAAKLLAVTPSVCAAAITELEQALGADALRGLSILRHGHSVQLVTKPACREVGQALIKDEFRAELSPAGLEVLTLIAYLGPVPRSTVDYIRGVNSSFTVRNLVVRGLAERDPDASRGNLYAYRASAMFLQHLGVVRIQDLPEYESYRAKLEMMNHERAENDERRETGEKPAVDTQLIS